MPDHFPKSSESTPLQSDTVRFAIFEFDFAKTELRRNGIIVRIQAQPAKVLAHLLAHNDRTVSREELHDAIWGTSTFVDFERGLNVCIAQIRAALGDDASTPRYIRTIPRKGYEFICPVQKIAAEPVAETPAPSPPRKYSAQILFASLAALLLLCAIVAGYLYAHSRARAIPITIAVARFDNETGDSHLDRFSDALTDDVVTQLTTSGDRNLRIIGNAAVLRVPRQQRDLKRIVEELHTQFVILGQVQRIGSQTRILAHLIRLPEQTHVWVVRINQPLDDPAALEASASREISTQFAAKLANPALLTALHTTSSR